MVEYTDFPNGLRDLNDYLNAQNSINAELSGSVADVGRLVISAEYDFTLKEIICSLLAGLGLKLPNIQICISLNLKELLGGIVGNVTDALYSALEEMDQAFDRFLDHLKLDEVLGRINNMIAEITSIANMINFCSAPLDPIQIPNVLENAMDSFLGAGRAIVDAIGQIIPDEIGGCLIDGEFNGAIFSGGILKKVWDNIDDLSAVEDSLIADINRVVADIDDLIGRENNIVGTYDNGGSDLAEKPRPVNDGIGVLYNANDEGIQGAVRNGSSLWAAYQQLGSYQVQDSDGNVYNNIFETFCDEDLLRILRRTPNPTPDISEQQPVYNYCGEIIGFTRVVSQENPETSVGNVPEPVNQPGWNAGGLTTNPITEAREEANSASNDTVNNITNVESPTLIVNSEQALLISNSSLGQMVYRTDNGVTYLNNGGTTGTLADYFVVGSAAAPAQTAWRGTVQTTNNSATEVLFGTPVSRRTPEVNTVWFIEITAVANRQGTSDTTAIKIEGLVDNRNGTVTVVGTSGNKTVYNSTPATANYDLTVDVVGGTDFRVQVTGETAHTVDWTVKLDYIEA